jgi:hypothetical protein
MLANRLAYGCRIAGSCELDTVDIPVRLNDPLPFMLKLAPFNMINKTPPGALI